MASAKVISGRLVAEFRAAWTEREAELERELQRAASFHAAEGRARSGGLLEDYARILSQGLATAKVVFLDRVRALASRHRRLSEGKVKSIAQAATSEIERLGAGFDSQLSNAASGMGLAALAPNVQVSVSALKATMMADIRHTFQTALPRVDVPWYHRPAGYVALTSLAGLIVWLISRQFK